MDGKAGRKLIEQLSKSRIYKDYERAFNEATGLPLTLRAVEYWQPAHRNKKNENPFCALMAARSRSCAACLEVQEKLSQDAGQESRTGICFAGMRDSVVPIRLGNTLVGFLQTGQVRTKKATRKQFRRAAQQLIDWGMKADLNRLEEAYFHTRVLSPKQYQSMVRLLVIFGQHLSLASNELAVQERQAEPPAVTRARKYISEHQAEKISLGAVARAVNTSTFYFCKMFKKATGLNFTDYLSRVRIEKAKNLLLNPNARIGEVGYEAGFQSLTHFNRVFKRVTGQSPSGYRMRKGGIVKEVKRGVNGRE
jgi:AraC-like DNA-binding protein/ligand-binding sensor protein